jgi:hypothetical protein
VSISISFHTSALGPEAVSPAGEVREAELSKNLSGCSGVCRVWQWGTVLGIAGPVPTLRNAETYNV